MAKKVKDKRQADAAEVAAPPPGLRPDGRLSRKAYEAALRAHPDWDQRTGQLQVSEARVGLVELKLVMSAVGPTELARLRFAMREAMLDWLREHCPEALCTEV